MAQLNLFLNLVSDHAAMIIQCHFRGLMARKKFLKVKTAAQVLQAVMRARFAVTRRDTLDKVNHAFPFLKLSSGNCSPYYLVIKP